MAKHSQTLTTFKIMYNAINPTMCLQIVSVSSTYAYRSLITHLYVRIMTRELLGYILVKRWLTLERCLSDWSIVGDSCAIY